jgi:CopG family transcriptional regulator/antitoxin EndoAI
MAKRINVILAENTVRTIDRLSRPGQRSRFIERAVQHYVATASPEALQERLKHAAIRDQDLDLEIATDWFSVDQEQWKKRDGSTMRTRTDTKDFAGLGVALLNPWDAL